MAIDTKDKRGSAFNVSLPYRPQLPSPSGGVEVGNRAAMCYLYDGVAATSVIQPNPWYQYLSQV